MRDSYPATVSSQFNAPSALQAAGSLPHRHPRDRRSRPEPGVIDLPLNRRHRHWPVEYSTAATSRASTSPPARSRRGLQPHPAYVGTRAIRQTARQHQLRLRPGQATAAGLASWGQVAADGGRRHVHAVQHRQLQRLPESVQAPQLARTGGMLGIVYTWSKSHLLRRQQRLRRSPGTSRKCGAATGAPAGLTARTTFQMYGVYRCRSARVRATPPGPGSQTHR